MLRTNDEWADIFQGIKEMVDNAYDLTKRKHGAANANIAMLAFLENNLVSCFTNDEGARDQVQELLDRPYEMNQILLDYAMSSFILNEMDGNMPYGEITNYADPNCILDYSKESVIKVVALSAAFNPEWTVGIISDNKKLRHNLVRSFIEERYVEDRRDELDNANSSRLVRFTDTDERFFVDRDKLNRAIRNMNQDEMLGEYIPPTRRSGDIKR